MTKLLKVIEEISEPTNGGAGAIKFSEPFTATVTLEGTADLLFHRWNPEAIDEKANASKNSKAKKTDDVESYVWRTENGELAIPGEYLRQSIINAAKFRQDPRSPRKSAMDLFKAAVVVTTPLSTLGKKKWDFLDRRRVQVQRQGINRTRPAIKIGWQARFELLVVLAEYVDPRTLRETIESAGRLIGMADNRPTNGRFGIIRFDVR